MLDAQLGHGFHPSEDAPPERVAGTLVLTPVFGSGPIFSGRAAPIKRVAVFVASLSEDQPHPHAKLVMSEFQKCGPIDLFPKVPCPADSFFFAYPKLLRYVLR